MTNYSYVVDHLWLPRVVCLRTLGYVDDEYVSVANLQLCNCAHTFKGGNFASYAYTCCKNAILNALPRSTETLTFEPIDHRYAVETYEFLSYLTADQRQVLELALEGYNNAEIAKAKKVSKQTIGRIFLEIGRRYMEFDPEVAWRRSGRVRRTI